MVSEKIFENVDRQMDEQTKVTGIQIALAFGSDELTSKNIKPCYSHVELQCKSAPKDQQMDNTV